MSKVTLLSEYNMTTYLANHELIPPKFYDHLYVYFDHISDILNHILIL